MGKALQDRNVNFFGNVQRDNRICRQQLQDAVERGVKDNPRLRDSDVGKYHFIYLTN